MDSAIVKRAVDQAMKEGGLEAIKQETIDIENLFLIWATNRSLGPIKLAEAAGMPVKKVREVLATGEFQKRYLEDTAGFRQVAKEYSRARAEEVMETVIDRMTDLVETGDPRDAIGAARVLVSMVEDAGPKEVHQTYVDARALQIAGQGIKTFEDMKKAIAAQTDGNINRVSEARAPKGK